MIKTIKNLTKLCLFTSTVSLMSAEVNATSNANWQMVWSDEFNGTQINTDNWVHETHCEPKNREKQCYSDGEEYSYTSDGTLKIVALPTPYNDLPYTSARMNSRYKADFKYGRFEISAKLPTGQGSWPAFWMKATDDVYGTWPHSGEIDIMEAINLKTTEEEDNGGNDEESRTSGALHYGKSWPDNAHSSKGYHLTNGVNPADGFHTYAVEWQEGEIRWYVDDVLFQTQRRSEVALDDDGLPYLTHRGWFAEHVADNGELTTHWDNSPFDQRFFMILNFAVGGIHPDAHNDFEDFEDTHHIDPDAFHSDNAYEIDYVRVYQCSLDVDTGEGCATGTVGDTLIEGKAPQPKPTPPPILAPTGEDLDIFSGTMNANWPAYFSNGSTPIIVTDDDKGDVVEFSVSMDATVAGFISRQGELTDPDGVVTPHNASTSVAAGVISFDMKVITNPSSAKWTLKVESFFAETAASLSFSDSVEGAIPTVGDWQTYTFNLSDLAVSGLDVEAIDAVMIYPGWSSGAGAVYQITNLAITTGVEKTEAEVVLFEDAENPSWPMWNSAGGPMPVVVLDEEDVHGNVAEFAITGNAVTGFVTRADKITDATAQPEPFNASSIVANGVVKFDLKVVNMPSDLATVWYFKAESVDAATNAKFALSDSIEGIAPTANQWQTYTFNLSDLAAAGLDLSAIDLLLVYPNWGQGAGAIYRIDNIKVYQPTVSDKFEGQVLLADQTEEPWSLYNCCKSPAPTLETDDTEHGVTAEFTGSASTLMGLKIANDGVYLDASSILANGVVQFEMKVIDAITTVGGYWQIKMESGDRSADTTFRLSDSQEGVEPVTGQWQTYTYSLQSFFDAGVDISEIDVVLISPNWSGGAGTKYRLDNVIIYDPSSLPAPQGLVIYDNAPNSAWLMWDSSYNTEPAVVTDNAHGAVAEFSVVGSAVMGFTTRPEKLTDPTLSEPFNGTSIVANGVVQFDLKVINMPSNPSTTWYFKIESVGSAFAKFELPESIEGIAPTVGQWQTYTFNLSDLELDGLDVSAIDTLLMYPAYGAGDGAVYRVDNVRVYEPTPLEAFEGQVLLADQVEEPWSLYNCCTSPAPTLKNDDAEHGMTAEFIGATSTLMGFKIANDGVYLDAFSLLANGVVQFDIKVIEPITTAGGYWQIKMESGDRAADKTFRLTDSQEGVEPVTGQWQTYTYSLQSFFDAGVDVSEIDVVLISPNWSGGAGTKYRLDNVMIYDLTSLPAPDNGPDFDGDGLADSIDPDDDNDGANDNIDHLPLDATIGVLGDLDGDLDVDAMDIRAFSRALRNGNLHSAYDLNGDDKINRQDMRSLVALCSERRCAVR